MAIDPTARIDPRAQIADDATIGAFVVIEGPVTIGAQSEVQAHAILTGDVHIGSHNLIGYGSVVGGDPQDLGFDRTQSTGVVLGDHNTLREYVTIHRSSTPNEPTTIGSHNYLMGACHLGHNTQLGDHNILANQALLAGFVQIGNRCFLGGASVFHQKIRVGDYCMIQGNSGFGMDIPPYAIAHGVNRIGGINLVGLRRGGFSKETIGEIRRAYRELFRGEQNLTQALEHMREKTWCPEVAALLNFVENRSARGVIPWKE